MLTAAEAKLITDTVVGGGSPAKVPTTIRKGNTLIDQANFNVVHGSMGGMYTTYVPISDYTREMVNNCVDTFLGLGYDVDRSRERSYKEIVLSWA